MSTFGCCTAACSVPLACFPPRSAPRCVALALRARTKEDCSCANAAPPRRLLALTRALCALVPPAAQLRANIQDEFRANRDESDPVKLQKMIEVAVNGYNQMSQYAHMTADNPNWDLRLVENPIQDPRQGLTLPEGGSPIDQLARGPAASPRPGGLAQFRASKPRAEPAIATSTSIDPLAIDGGADAQDRPLAYGERAAAPDSGSASNPFGSGSAAEEFAARVAAASAAFDETNSDDARKMLSKSSLPPRVARMRAEQEKRARAAAAAAARDQ